MTVSEVLNLVPLFVLVFFRLTGMMLFAPLFGSTRIPKRVKVLVALIIAMLMTGALGNRQIALPKTVWELALGIAGEMCFGIAMGMIVSLVFISAQWAGEIIGTQMGLNISEVLDPQFGQAGSLIGEMYFMLTMIVFVSPAVEGHRALVMGVRASFDTLPLLSAGMSRPLLDTLAGLLQSSAGLAIRLAAPMLMTMLVVDLALGCIGKAMPQMNVMAMGLSLRAIIGTIVLVIGLGMTNRVLGDMLLESGDTMQAQWIAPPITSQ